MKVLTALVMIISMLCGCQAKHDTLEQAASLRKSLLASNGCSFQTQITADYGDKVHTFQMDCNVDNIGNLSFTVSNPETIRGITGHISQDAAALTFDGKVLAFPMLADGNISPVCSPWLFINALRGGYISGCSEDDSELCIYIDDSFHDHPLQFEIFTDEDTIPIHVDLVWQNSRILSLDIQNFVIQ